MAAGDYVAIVAHSQEAHSLEITELVMRTISPEPIRVLLIDGQSVVRAGLRMLLRSWPDVEIVDEAETLEKAQSVLERWTPDIILLNYHIDQDNEIEFLRRLKATAADHRMILLISSLGTETQPAALGLGVAAAVRRENAASQLHTAIRRVHNGELWRDPGLAGSTVSETPAAPVKNIAPQTPREALTEREEEVAQLVCQALKNKEIADRLGISETTVRHHVASILGKLGVSSRFELAILRYRQNFAKGMITARRGAGPAEEESCRKHAKVSAGAFGRNIVTSPLDTGQSHDLSNPMCAPIGKSRV